LIFAVMRFLQSRPLYQHAYLSLQILLGCDLIII
jgi:hypothetical protein